MRVRDDFFSIEENRQQIVAAQFEYCFALVNAFVIESGKGDSGFDIRQIAFEIQKSTI